MARVNNATGVYATLGYNYNDPNGDVQDFSANTQANLNTMPAFINSWQAQDIANNNIGGYFQNPVTDSTNSVINTTISITSLYASLNGIAGLETVNARAQTLYISANSFLYHTNRLSGVTPFAGDFDYPYYETASNYGKTAVYIVNQTDGIVNNSTILGSFTSLLAKPQVDANAVTISSYVTLIQNSLSGNTTNLTAMQITTIESGLLTTNTLLTTRQSSDETFFNNLKSFNDKYNEVRQFSNLGESQTYLIENFIGSPKLLARLNQG